MVLRGDTHYQTVSIAAGASRSLANQRYTTGSQSSTDVQSRCDGYLCMNVIFRWVNIKIICQL